MFLSLRSAGRAWEIVELHEVHSLAPPVLCDFEKVDDPPEPRAPRQPRSDVVQRDSLEGVHLDLAPLHLVASTDLHPWLLPDADAAGDLPPPNPCAEVLRELHSL